MRFANVRELKLNTNRVLAMTKKEGPVVVTRHGKPVAILRSINENDLTIKAAPLWDRLQVAAKQAGYGPSDVEKLIKRSRKEK